MIGHNQLFIKVAQRCSNGSVGSVFEWVGRTKYKKMGSIDNWGNLSSVVEMIKKYIVSSLHEIF